MSSSESSPDSGDQRRRDISRKRTSSLRHTKMKSRLPEIYQRYSGTSSDIDDDHPFLNDALPHEYKQLRYSKWTLLELFCLILTLGALVCTLIIPFFKHHTLFDLELWRWEAMIVVLICTWLVSGWGVKIVVILMQQNSVLRKNVLYFVYQLRKTIRKCVWLALVLIALQLTLQQKLERMTHGVTKILICLLVGAIAWLLKTLLVKVVAYSFHVSTFFNRIQEALFYQYVIKTLSGPPMIEIQQEEEEECRLLEEVQKLQNAGAILPPDLKESMFKKSGMFIGTPRVDTPKDTTPKEVDDGFTIDHLNRLNQKNISAWYMQRLMNIVCTGVLSTLDKQPEGSTRDEDESVVRIRNEKQAKVAAKKIFSNVAKPGSRRIYLADLMRFLTKDEALKLIQLFDGESETKRISKRALKNRLVNVFRERRALALSLNNTKTAINNLHQMLKVVVGNCIIVIWLLILKIGTAYFLILTGPQVLLAWFVFGNTWIIFEAIIFLFVMHPFDVGDRCKVDGVEMVVEEMNIFTTVFF